MNRIIQEDMEEIINSGVPLEMMNQKTILITGATGMIPSYMALTLLYSNEKIENFNCNLILHIRSREKAERFFGEYIGKPYLKFVSEEIDKLIIDDKIDYIIHGASPASPQLFITNPVQTLEPNVLGTYHLLDMAKEKRIEGFLLFSSGEVYGQVPKGRVISEKTYGLVDPLIIRNVYAESKRMAEMMCRAYYEQYSVLTKIARISHTYGPTMTFENNQRVFSEFVQNILNNEDIVIKSDGTAVRPFCYLTDATIALFKILLCGKSGEAYNMCNDLCNVSIRELAEILVSSFPEKKLKVKSQVQENEDLYRESQKQKPCIVSNQKLRDLGWKPEIDIREGFIRTIKSFEESIE